MAVTVPLASGLLISVEPSLVTCIEEIDATACRLYWSDSSPGQSDSYVVIALDYTTLTGALGPPADWVSLPTIPYGFGGNVGFATSKITAIEATPGDTACRVYVGSDRTSGYIVVPGTLANVTAALTPPPPPQPIPQYLAATGRANLPAPSIVPTQVCAVFSPVTLAATPAASVVFDSAAPAKFTAQLRELASATVVATFVEPVPLAGERAQKVTTWAGLQSSTWYVLEAQETGGVAGQILGMVIEL